MKDKLNIYLVCVLMITGFSGIYSVNKQNRQYLKLLSEHTATLTEVDEWLGKYSDLQGEYMKQLQLCNDEGLT